MLPKFDQLIKEVFGIGQVKITCQAKHFLFPGAVAKERVARVNAIGSEGTIAHVAQVNIAFKGEWLNGIKPLFFNFFNNLKNGLRGNGAFA